MKLAVISDIHGNLPALNAVLADIQFHGVDQIVNLGDIVSGGLFPAETADRLMPKLSYNKRQSRATTSRNGFYRHEFIRQTCVQKSSG